MTSPRTTLLRRAGLTGTLLVLVQLALPLAERALRAAEGQSEAGGPPMLLASGPAFRVIVQGSLLGLSIATLVIVLIWVHEARGGKVW
jgi:hypothetical protein